MRDPKELTRVEVLRAASTLRWRRKLPKWTVVIDGRELPARPVVLTAAGVPPNDPTNSHQAVAILKSLGFETRYAPERPNTNSSPERAPDSETGCESDNLASLFTQIAKDVPENDWEQVPADLSTNLDHYLYGSKKTSR
jgi:hypothetical protein